MRSQMQLLIGSYNAPSGDLQKVFCSFASFGGRQVGHSPHSLLACAQILL